MYKVSDASFYSELEFNLFISYSHGVRKLLGQSWTEDID